MYRTKMISNISIEHIQSLVKQGLERTGLSQHRASMLATGKRDALRAISYGKMPSVDRWAAICRVLDIPFHTGFGTDSSDSDIVGAWCLRADGLDANPALPDIPTYLASRAWYVVELADPVADWSQGDLLFFDDEDPLSGLIDRLIGRWCLVKTAESAADESWCLGRCRRADDGNPKHINLESATGQATKTNLKPLKCLPLRIVAPRV
jgi:hypothetical protein